MAAQARQAGLQVIPHHLLHLAQAARAAQERPQQLAVLASLMLAVVAALDLNKAAPTPVSVDRAARAAVEMAVKTGLLVLPEL